MKKLVAACSILISIFCEAQDIFLLQDPGNSFVFLNDRWTYKMGDQPMASLTDYEGPGWKPIRPGADIHDSIPADAKIGIGWIRLRFRVSEDARKQKLAIMVRQSVASEIYLNGRMIKQYGTVSDNPSAIKAYDPRWEPVLMEISAHSIQVLTIRFAVQPEIKYATHYGSVNPFLSIRVMRNDKAIEKYKGIYMQPWMGIFMQGITFMVFILHISFFLMFPVQRANLFFALAALLLFLGSQIHNYYSYGGFPDQKFFLAIVASVFYSASHLLMFKSIQNYLKIRTSTSFWVLAVIHSFGILVSAVWYNKGFVFVLVPIQVLTYLFIIFISIAAQKKQVKEARILTIGFSIAIASFLSFLTIAVNNPGDTLLLPLFNPGSFFFLVYTLGPPTAVSIFLASDFARTSKRLQQKLDEVEILSQKNVAVEREKQELLASQNQQLEEKVRERTAALNHSLNELKSTQTQLIQAEKMASLGELTAGIAHEIQNPLNFVNNFSEVNAELIQELKSEKSKIKTERDDELENQLLNDLEQNLEKINHHGKRADAIVKGMLQHTRTSSGVKEPTDINALADEYLRLAYHGLRAKDKSFNATIKTDFDQSIGNINIIPQDIGRVVLNLINNAFYAASLPSPDKIGINAGGFLESDRNKNPTVWVSTKKVGDKVLISVRDNGPGIPQKILDKIFQPFFTTKPTGQGTGLGLSLAYDIVKAHGGDIKVQSKEGDGSELIIKLPIA